MNFMRPKNIQTYVTSSNAVGLPRNMSTKKTATKKVARKRTSKNETEAGVVEATTESAPVNSENVEESIKKPAKNSVADDSSNSNDAPEQTERKEPIQGVRDTRTQKTDDEAVKPESRNPEDTRSQQDENSAEGDQNQQGKGRNRRGRRNRTKGDQPQAQQQVQVPQIDAKELSKRAWKIFLSEVSEEGLALIGDKEGRELSKRSFRLAEIFLEEQGRRNVPNPKPKSQPQQQRRRHNQDVIPVAEEVTSTEEERAVVVAADITPVETPRAEVAPPAQSED